MNEGALWDTAHAHLTECGDFIASEAIGQESGMVAERARIGQAALKQQEGGGHEDQAFNPAVVRTMPQTPGKASANTKMPPCSRRLTRRFYHANSPPAHARRRQRAVVLHFEKWGGNNGT